MVGGVKLYNGKNAKLVPDRFGRSLSALSFNSGYYQLPPGSYLSNNFTVSDWVYERSYTYWHRIFDFSNGPGFDAVCFAYTYETNGHPVFDYTFDSSLTATLTHSSILPLNSWTHLAVTVDNSNLVIKIYMKGTNIQSLTYSPSISFSSFKKYNYFGHDSYRSTFADAIIDEFKIFNRALSQQEILFEMNNEIY